MAEEELSPREAVHLRGAQIYGVPLSLFQPQLVFPPARGRTMDLAQPHLPSDTHSAPGQGQVSSNRGSWENDLYRVTKGRGSGENVTLSNLPRCRRIFCLPLVIATLWTLTHPPSYR